ncbi:MAG: M24 family metallopeptidase [Saprospiraceae bacterium]|nr:M24 family metallopeptidase [Saprospiraceae bacterium]
MKLFDRVVYQTRRQALMAGMETGLIWIQGNELSPKNYRDNTFHFRQDSNFLYYCGIDQPGLSLLMDLASGDTFLCGRDITLDHVIWMGPQRSLSELAEQTGMSGVLSEDALHAMLQAAGSAAVHYLPPYKGESILKVHAYLGVAIEDVTTKASDRLIETVVSQRSIKEDRELAEMEYALELSRDMHLEMIYEAKAGVKESHIVAKIMEIVHRHEVDTAYPVILSVRGEILHNHHHHLTLQDGQLVLGDFGAESSMNYAGDITRTVPVASTFNSQQKDIYQSVLRAQAAAIEALKPGISYQEVHLLAAKQMVLDLKDLGLMIGNADEAVAEGAHALFFPHGLGHMIGLDVHDMEDLGEDKVGYDQEVKRSDQFGLNALRLGRKLRVGFTLTVEPGLYFIQPLIDQWKSLKRCDSFINYDKLTPFENFGGIRIEDNYVITNGGSRLLGPSIPKQVEEIEFLSGLDKYIA